MSGKQSKRINMRGKNTIFINGRHYDVITGLPHESAIKDQSAMSGPPPKAIRPDTAVDAATPVTKPAPVAHQSTVKRPAPQKAAFTAQKSKTLRREAVKRPVGAHEATIARPRRDPVAVAKSPTISRFATHPQVRLIHAAPTSKALDGIRPKSIAPVAVVAPAHRALPSTKPQANTQKPAALSSRQLKEQLIAKQLAAAVPAPTHKKKSRSVFSSVPKASSVITACFALIVLGGYLTYLNMPNISVRVAASQAGVDARFPEYRPDGYRFNGPIAFAPGEVTMNFQSNGGNQTYAIKQSNSSWDSQAVLDNFVTKKSDSYLTYSEEGLTIYTFSSNAAWVNGGVLYTIEGDAPLTNEQVLRIAASM